MSVKQEADGRRSVQLEFEVPGTPEDVWQALATGPGISSWFVPTDLVERDGKPVALTYHFGPGMDIRAKVISCDRPRQFTQEGEGPFPGAPPIATAWTIEARSGSICTVRIVHSLFASTDEWDNQLEGAAGGWSGFLNILRLYLTHFRGQRSALMQLMTPVSSTEAEAWALLTAGLGVKSQSIGKSWATPAGVPSLSGVVEHFTAAPYDALLRLEKPAPAIAALGVFTFPGGGPTTVAMNFYVYGDKAADIVARETPVWQAWLQERFPMAAELGKTQ